MLLNYNLTKDVMHTIRNTHTRAWSVYNPLTDRVTSYVWCPIPTIKKHLHTTSFHRREDAEAYLGTYAMRLPEDLASVTRESFRTFTSQSYVILHEPMLHLNTIEMFLARVKTVTRKDHNRVQTHIALRTDTDIVMYCKQLLSVVFLVWTNLESLLWFVGNERFSIIWTSAPSLLKQ